MLEAFDILPRWRNRFSKLEWGDTRFLNNAIETASRNAFSQAENCVKGLKGHCDSIQKVLNIDYQLILLKFLFANILYKKYFFYELAIQYKEENKLPMCDFIIEGEFLGVYRQRLQPHFRTHVIPSFPLARFLGAILCFQILFEYWRFKLINDPHFKKDILCFVASLDELQCYEQLFRNMSPKYVTNETYISSFSEEEVRRFNIVKMGLGRKDYISLRSRLFHLLCQAFTEMQFYKLLGSDFLSLLNLIIHGRANAPSGSGNIFIVFEHHDLVKTIRNEFIRADGGKSIYFPYLPWFSLRYYPEEYCDNYDCVCLSGKAVRDTLSENLSRSKRLFETGCYVMHKPEDGSVSARNRIARLQAFKGGFRSVTILSPGFCKPTYLSEQKLVDLAIELARDQNLRIFIRLKTQPEADTTRMQFYRSRLEGVENIYLTEGHYELLDFLHCSDLFVTSYSTSACEIALRGGSVFFVDFMHQQDRFIFWGQAFSKCLVLSENEAHEAITNWLSADQSGSNMKSYMSALRQFREYIGYQCGDFETYKMKVKAAIQEECLPETIANNAS